MNTQLKYPGLEHQPDAGANRGWLYQTLRRFLRSQFGRPAGIVGNLAGIIMRNTPSNLDRIHWTISLLEIQPQDRVLEVGFGPGVSVEMVSGIVKSGFVAGVDHSDVMVKQASRRNAKAIRNGRVALSLGSASKLPPFDRPFDKIFTINSIHFWENPVKCLEGLGDLLKPGGRIAVTIQPRTRSATDGATAVIGDEIAANLVRAGFSNCRVELKKLQSGTVACVLATRQSQGLPRVSEQA